MTDNIRYVTGIDHYPPDLSYFAFRTDFPTMIARGATLGEALRLLGSMIDTMEKTGTPVEAAVGGPVAVAETVAIAETMHTRHEFGGRVA
jgi:predicted RNase H-like HicB family nuclease